VVNAQRSDGRHFEVAKRRDSQTDNVTTDCRRAVFSACFRCINPFFEWLQLTRFTLRFHDVRQVRSQVAKFLQELSEIGSILFFRVVRRICG